MNEDFEAQRAVLNAELTAIAVSGGDTAKVRAKLAKLDEREQAAAHAVAQAQAAVAEVQKDFVAERGLAIALDSARAVEELGHDVSDADMAQLKHFGCQIARIDADLVERNNEHAVATQQVAAVQGRIDVLQERSRALQDLRILGQAVDRDLNEAVLIEKDLTTLAEVLAQAQRAADALQVPAELLHQRAAIQQQMAQFERGIVLRNLKSRAEAAEAEFLGCLRELVQVSGATHPGYVYTRSRELDRYVHHGQL